MTATKVEHYKRCRRMLDVKLRRAKKIVDRLYEEVEMEPEHSEDVDWEQDYERMQSQLRAEAKRERAQRRRDQRDQWAREQGTMIVVHYSDGEQAAGLVDESIASIVEAVGCGWAEEPMFTLEEYTFGNIAGAGILEHLHLKLEAGPINPHVGPEDVEYVKLRSADV